MSPRKPTLRLLLARFLACLAIPALAIPAPALAAEASERRVHRVEVPLSATAAAEAVRVPRFDPALGKLKRVELRLGGQLVVAGSVENLGAREQRTEERAGLELRLTLPSGKPVSVKAHDSARRALPAFDGRKDHAGPSASGVSLTASKKSKPRVFTSAEMLELFTSRPGDRGRIYLPLEAAFDAAVTGEKLDALLVARASASIEVVYVYE